MAEGLLNSLHGYAYVAYSAGTEPTIVNPYAIQVMSEIGIDISKHRSKSSDEFMKQKFDNVNLSKQRSQSFGQTCPLFFVTTLSPSLPKIAYVCVWMLKAK